MGANDSGLSVGDDDVVVFVAMKSNAPPDTASDTHADTSTVSHPAIPSLPQIYCCIKYYFKLMPFQRHFNVHVRYISLAH